MEVLKYLVTRREDVEWATVCEHIKGIWRMNDEEYHKDRVQRLKRFKVLFNILKILFFNPVGALLFCSHIITSSFQVKGPKYFYTFSSGCECLLLRNTCK